MAKRELVGVTEQRAWIPREDKYSTLLIQYWSSGTVTWEWKE